MPLTSAEAKELKTALDIYHINRHALEVAQENYNKADKLLKNTVDKFKEKEPI